MAVALLVLELLFYLSLTSPTSRARLLGALPDRVEARYIGFILGNGDGYFRSAAHKCEMIKMLEAGKAAGIRLSYDPAALIPFAGNRAALTYRENCIEEPTRIKAGRLLFGTGDPALVRKAFAAHAGDSVSIEYLCTWFDEANLRFPGYRELQRSNCPPAEAHPTAAPAAAGPTPPPA